MLGIISFFTFTTPIFHSFKNVQSSKNGCGLVSFDLSHANQWFAQKCTIAHDTVMHFLTQLRTSTVLSLCMHFDIHALYDSLQCLCLFLHCLKYSFLTRTREMNIKILTMFYQVSPDGGWRISIERLWKKVSFAFI